MSITTVANLWRLSATELAHAIRARDVSSREVIGRIPHATNIEFIDEPIGVQLTAVQGPMARRVADLRVALEVLAGPTWRDPWSVPALLRGPAPPRPVRVTLVVDPGGVGTAAQVQDGVRKAATTLEDAGYLVDEVEPPSILNAAKTILDMLNTPEIRAGYESFSAHRGPSRRHLRWTASGGAGDRPASPRGPVPGRRSVAGGAARDHHADRPDE